MRRSKDSEEVVNFIASFQKLREWIDDDPDGLVEIAAADELLRDQCIAVHELADEISESERRSRQLYAAPVDPNFIDVWRVYESRYADVLLTIWSDFLLPGFGSLRGGIPEDPEWDVADAGAEEQEKAIDGAIDFAFEQATEDHRDLGQDFRESIEQGAEAWDRLKDTTSFDLRGIFRRRELVPFVLVPRSVASRYGNSKMGSLLALLQQAHDAFVFGVPSAAIALMRSILEVVLRDHYGAQGVDLKDRIDRCQSLPKGAPQSPQSGLHRIRRRANEILHTSSISDGPGEGPTQQSLETEILSMLVVLRALIEGVPGRGRS